jgi:hypothetical protein
MLYDVTSTQPVADVLKALVSAVRPETLTEARLQKAALKLIGTFESFPWRPVLFEEAVAFFAVCAYAFTPAEVRYEAPDWMSSKDVPMRVLMDVHSVLEEYVGAVGRG